MLPKITDGVLSEESPAFQWNATDFLADKTVLIMSLEQRGALFTRIFTAAAEQDYEFLNSIPWLKVVSK